MSELIRMIDEWRDAHGQPSDASISRAISGSDKTVNAWRNRGIKAMPDRETLHKLAQFLHVQVEAVILAALWDAGYLPRKGEADGEIITRQQREIPTKAQDAG